MYNTLFFSFFIVALSCLSSQLVRKFSFFEFILILSKRYFKVNWMTCARQDILFESRTFVSMLSNILVRNKSINSSCIVRLFSTLSFVITYCDEGGMQSHGMIEGAKNVDRHHRRQRMKIILFLSHCCAINSEQWSFRSFFFFLRDEIDFARRLDFDSTI